MLPDVDSRCGEVVSQCGQELQGRNDPRVADIGRIEDSPDVDHQDGYDERDARECYGGRQSEFLGDLH